MASRRNVGLICFVLVMLLAACGPVLGAAVGSGHGSWVRVTLESGEVVDIWLPDATDANEVAAAVAALESWAVTVSEEAGSLLSSQSSGVSGYEVVAKKKPPPAEYNDRIAEKYEKMHEKLNELVDQATDPNVELFTEEQKERMKNARGRAGRSRKRVHEAGGFKKWARNQKVNCYVVEYVTADSSDPYYLDGDDDGECEKGELCSEVLDDGIGNEDGVCPWRDCGKKKGEICVENCDQDAIEDMNDNFDPNAAADVEQSLDDVMAALEETGQEMKVRIEMMAAAKAVSSAVAVASDPNDKCGDLYLPVSRQRGRSYEELQITLGAANAVTMAYNACDSACNEDVLGFNGSAICVGLAIAAGIVNEVYDAFELQDDTVTAEQVDAACECLKQTSEAIGDIQKELLLLKELVIRRFNDIEVLLNTPEGQRPDWPVKTAGSKRKGSRKK